MKTNIKFRIAIYSISCLMWIRVVTSVMLAGVAQSFPDVSTVLVQSTYTTGTLFAMMGNFLAWPLTARFPIKRIIICCACLAIVGSALGFFMLGSIFWVMAANACIGLSAGLFASCAPILIMMHSAPSERAGMLGLQNAFMNIGSTIFTFVSGLITNINWRYNYLVFLLFLPLIAIVVTCLPNDNAAAEKEKKSSGGRIPADLAKILVSVFLFNLCFGTLHSNIALYITEYSIGTSSLVGTVMSLHTIAAMACGFVSGWIDRRFGKMSYLLSILVSLIGLGLLYVSHSVFSCYAACIILGIGVGINFMASTLLCSSVVDAHSNSMALSLNGAFTNMGRFFNPYVITTGAALLSSEVDTRFSLSTVILAVLTAAIIPFLKRLSKNKT